MDRARVGLTVLVVATAIGVVTQLLFYGVAAGINVPLAIAMVLLAGWLVSLRVAAKRPGWTDAWIAPTALVVAAFVAIRGDATLLALDVLGSIGLTLAAFASFGGLAVIRRPFDRVLQLMGRVVGWSLVGGGAVIRVIGPALPSGRMVQASRRIGPILWGVLLAIPLLVVFGALFIAADAVFARLAGDLFNLDVDLEDAVGRVLMAVVVAWLVAGLLAFVTLRDPTRDPPATPGGVNRPRLEAVSAVVVLMALDLLFAGFVVIQATYLFGGRDTLDATGLTYAEYARRGFFELLAVAFLAAGVILALDAFIGRRTRPYVGSAVILVILTVVVLGSSYLRLRLYQDAYGWTELRFYVLTAICWLAVGAVAAIVTLAANRVRWLPLVMVGLAVVFGLAVNIIGPVRFIAEQNIARAVDPSLVPSGGETGLDVWYLASLGTDADIALAESLEQLPAEVRAEVEQILANKAYELATDERSMAWQAWNLSRERARDLLLP